MTIVYFIIVLGILIFVHEFGHFIVAKKTGVRVEKFSFGFGPKLIGKKIGETEYLISALPFGGYVKMTGENPEDEEEEKEEGEEKEKIDLENDPHSFMARSPYTKIGIVLAGPVMNLLLALVIMPLVFMIGIQLPAYLEKPVKVSLIDEGSPAAIAGIKQGDLITSIDNKTITDWEDLRMFVLQNPNTSAVISLERKGLSQDVLVRIGTLPRTGVGYLGITPPLDPVVGSVMPGTPAQDAGLKKGDRIVAIDGKPLGHWLTMSEIIKNSPGEKLSIDIERDGMVIAVQIVPKLDEQHQVGLIGITALEETITARFDFWLSIKEGVKKNFHLYALTFEVLYKLISGQLSVKALGGPVMIAQVTGEAARTGLSSLLQLLAFISIQLGILNLLPIPVLDGGHIVFYLIEIIIRRPLDLRKRRIAQQLGLVFLVALMVLVTCNDIERTWQVSKYIKKIGEIFH